MQFITDSHFPRYYLVHFRLRNALKVRHRIQREIAKETNFIEYNPNDVVL